MKQKLLRLLRSNKTTHQLLMRVRGKWRDFRYGKRDSEDVFSEIYDTQYWSDGESRSGLGSSLEQTKLLITELPQIWKSLDVKTVLDLPCGDFCWMQKVDLSQFQYIGADLVGSVIESNQQKYGSDNVQFRKLDLTNDPLPDADLILVRDCLVHLTFEQIENAIKNICKSNIKYLMTTTFVEHDFNVEIITGQWRALNLTKSPLTFPEPEILLREGSTVGLDEYADKSLAIWKVSSLRTRFELDSRAVQ